MAEVHRLPTREELAGTAFEWLARLNADNVSLDDRARCDAWRGESPGHERAFAEASLIWSQLAKAGESARAVSTGHAFHAITERAIHRTLRARTRNRRLAVVAAASMVLAIGAFWWSGHQSIDNVFQTSIGEHSTIKLPDGSSLELNSNSLVRLAYDAHARVVKLERGEAYFDVSRDAKRPFWVAAGNSWVGAVGTAFSVDLRSAGIRVTVNEGAVKVAQAASGEPVAVEGSLVKAGQQLNVRSNAVEVRSLAAIQLRRSLAWREGQVYFKDDRLADVVEELSRYSALQIVFETQDLGDFPIAGTFETNPEGIEALLSVLSDGFGLSVRRSGETVCVARR